MKILLIWAFLMNSYSLFKTGDCASHNQILSVRASTQEQVDILENITRHEELYESVLLQPVSPWHIKAEADVHLFVSANRSEAVMDLLQKHSISHQVLLNNTNELMELQTRRLPNTTRSSSSFYETYHSLEEIYEWIEDIVLGYPEMVETFSIGSSFENRSLQALKLSGEKKANKKAIWMDCGFHAREWISPAFCLWFVQHCLTNYKQDQNITHLLDNMDVYVLPVMNPDGYKYTWLRTFTNRNRMWRKNRSHRKGSLCTGVDLNRNFDANWCTEGASNNTCSETYCGPAAHSEPETQALAEFLRNHIDSVQIYYTIHSYSQMLLFPYSYTLDKVPNHDELMGLVKEVAEKINASSGSTYKYGPGAETIYLCPGGSDDWAYDLGIKYSFTFELQDTGEYGFLLPPSRIPQACREALIAVQTIALRVIEKTKPDSPDSKTLIDV